LLVVAAIDCYEVTTLRICMMSSQRNTKAVVQLASQL